MISPALFDSIPQCFVVGYELPMKFRAAQIDRIPGLAMYATSLRNT